MQAKCAKSVSLFFYFEMFYINCVCLVNRIHQQLNADQNAALHPDCKTSFRSQDDAFKRLLRYHVFDWPSPSDKDIERCKQNSSI